MHPSRNSRLPEAAKAAFRPVITRLFKYPSASEAGQARRNRSARARWVTFRAFVRRVEKLRGNRSRAWSSSKLTHARAAKEAPGRCAMVLLGVKPPTRAFRELSQIVARFADSAGLRPKTAPSRPLESAPFDLRTRRVREPHVVDRVMLSRRAGMARSHLGRRPGCRTAGGPPPGAPRAGAGCARQ
jgi:hypothetical protein